MSKASFLSKLRDALEPLLDLAHATKQQQHALVSKLYDIPLRTMEEILLQLLHTSMIQSYEDIQELLVSLLYFISGRSFLVALRLSWSITSILPTFKALGSSNKINEILDCVESYAINRRSHFHAEVLADNTELDREIWRKEARLKIFNDVRSFTFTLTELGDSLRHYSDKPKRLTELRRNLTLFNQVIHNYRLVHPLGRSVDPVRWIVNIVVDDCVVFSSRERAPYLIRYELIVDDTATMEDPTASRLRLRDGSFLVSPDSEEKFSPCFDGNTQSKDAMRGNHWNDTSPAKGTSGEDYLNMAFGPSPEERKSRIRMHSAYGAHPNWSTGCMIVKAGDDLRQEELALQFINLMNNIWLDEGLTCRVRPYIALPTTSDCGLLEVIEDSNSIDGIKKACGLQSLYQFFQRAYEGEGSPAYREAQRNFIETMAGYSIVTYLIQIKDRHNGNLMISRNGDLVHIDFGFILTTSPGGLNFEAAPFKLSQELLDVMGGAMSPTFQYYKILIFQGLVAARYRADEIIALFSLMIPQNKMPCFGVDPHAAVRQLRDRLRCDLETEAEYAYYVKELITRSMDNWRTKRYDQFQTLQNGIL